MSTSHLTLPAQCLRLDGPDALSFAQAQFSNDVHALAIGQWQFNAWLDAQGRVRALFHLLRIEEQRLLLVLRGGRAEDLIEPLRRFVFRSKLSIEALPARLITDAPALPLYSWQHDDNAVLLGCGDHSMRLDAQTLSDHPIEQAWRGRQIARSWPWLPDAALSSLLSPALALEQLPAIAFDKGCYPGQEIVARLHYRGGHKRHLHRATVPAQVAAGSVVYESTREVGQLLDVYTDHRAEVGDALLVLNDDAITAFHTNGLKCNNGEHVTSADSM
jgi:folate-binding protein YgfZ